MLGPSGRAHARGSRASSVLDLALELAGPPGLLSSRAQGGPSGAGKTGGAVLRGARRGAPASRAVGERQRVRCAALARRLARHRGRRRAGAGAAAAAATSVSGRRALPAFRRAWQNVAYGAAPRVPQAGVGIRRRRRAAALLRALRGHAHLDGSRSPADARFHGRRARRRQSRSRAPRAAAARARGLLDAEARSPRARPRARGGRRGDARARGRWKAFARPRPRQPVLVVTHAFAEAATLGRQGRRDGRLRGRVGLQPRATRASLFRGRQRSRWPGYVADY